MISGIMRVPLFGTKPKERIKEPDKPLTPEQKTAAYLKRTERSQSFLHTAGMFGGLIFANNAINAALAANPWGAVNYGLSAALFGYYYKSADNVIKRIRKEGGETLEAVKSGVDPSVSKVQNSPPKKWTMMYFMGGANNLHPMAVRSFQSLLKEGSDENVNLAVQISTYGTRRGIIGEEPGKKGNHSFTYDHLGMQDMGDPKVLKQFILWSMEKCPAENFALVLWDHGGGFVGTMTDDYSGGQLSNKALAQVLKEIKNETGKEIGLVNFNACLMANLEAMHDIGKSAPLVVASEEVEAGLQIPVYRLLGTTPQHKIIRDLKLGIQERGEISPEELGRLYVYESRNQLGTRMFTPTQSLLDTKKLKPLEDSVNRLADYLIAAMQKDPSLKPMLQEHIRKTQHFLNADMNVKPYQDFRDLGDFASRLSRDDSLPDPKIRPLAQGVLTSVRRMVLSEEHADLSYTRQSEANAHGISIWLPEKYSTDYHTEFSRYPDYATLDFAKDTSWDKFLHAVSNDSAQVKHQDHAVAQLKNMALTFAQINPYFDAVMMVAGQVATSVLPINPISAILDPVGGIVRVKKGLEMMRVGSDSGWGFKKKAKFYAQGAMETAIGVSSTMLPFVALYPALVPALIAGVGLGIARTAYGLGKGLVKAVRLRSLSVSDKLDQSMEKSLKRRRLHLRASLA